MAIEALTMARARAVAPAFDVGALLVEWRAELEAQGLSPEELDEPDETFLAFCERWALRNDSR